MYTQKGNTMQVNFRFKTGDILTTRASRKGMEIQSEVRRDFPVHVELLLTVRERHMSECPGGIQLSYLCRIEGIAVTHSITTQGVSFDEIELTDDLSPITTEAQKP